MHHFGVRLMEEGGQRLSFSFISPDAAGLPLCHPPQVTMIILAKDLGIPKPFGPVMGGECCLERQTRSLLEPLGLRCCFLEEVASYHGRLGEVRCGTNVQRQPFAFKWWHVTP